MRGEEAKRLIATRDRTAETAERLIMEIISRTGASFLTALYPFRLTPRLHRGNKQLTLPCSPVVSVPFQPMKTFSAKANEVPRKWWIIDANNQVLGRVAVKAANLLRGKEKAIYTNHVDTGDFVVVINAEKVRLTGKKEDQKTYMSYSGFVGGHKSENAKARRERHPELMVERAIRGMIPHNKLGRAVYRKLKVYKGDLHPHTAQQPAAVTLA